MNRVRLGNDDLILYIRKSGQSRRTNAELGRRLWIWIRDNGHGMKTDRDQPCRWGVTGEHVAGSKLPKTATQFEFDIEALPALYRYADRLAA